MNINYFRFVPFRSVPFHSDSFPCAKKKKTNDSLRFIPFRFVPSMYVPFSFFYIPNSFGFASVPFCSVPLDSFIVQRDSNQYGTEWNGKERNGTNRFPPISAKNPQNFPIKRCLSIALDSASAAGTFTIGLKICCRPEASEGFYGGPWAQ